MSSSKNLEVSSNIVQEQSEEIVSLKKTVQELKDEITRLTKTPKRPKFRPGGGNPKARSGAPGNNTGRIKTLKQTCARLGVSFWEYLSRWFRGDPIDLAQFVHERYQTASPATP